MQSIQEELTKVQRLEELRAKFEKAGMTVEAEQVTQELYNLKRAFVVDHLSWKGRYHTKLTAGQVVEAYRRADGFGPWDSELEEYFKGGLDWSHIRDSSDIGFAMVFDYLQSQLYS